MLLLLHQPSYILLTILVALVVLVVIHLTAAFLLAVVLGLRLLQSAYHMVSSRVEKGSGETQSAVAGNSCSCRIAHVCCCCWHP